MLDFHDKTGVFLPLRGGSSCCAYTVQLQSQCDILGLPLTQRLCVIKS